MNHDRIYRTVAKTAMVAASLAAGFLICEFASRFIWPPGKIPPAWKYDLEKVPAPYVMFKGNRDDLAQVGPHGYKGEPPAPAKPPGETRVFMLGGSTLFNGPTNIPANVESLAREAGMGAVKVFNYSIPSSKSGEELARLIYEVSNHEPDIVIFYDGANDLADPNGDPRPGYPFNFMTMEANPLLIRADRPYPTFTLLLFGSNFLRHFFQDFFLERLIGYDRLQMEAGYRSPPWTEEAFENYWKNLTRADAFSRAVGARFFHFFQPTKFFYDFERRGHPFDRERWWDYESPNSLRGRELYRERAKAHPRLKTTDLSDMLNARVDRETFLTWTDDGVLNFDPIHVLDDVNRPIAAEIFKTIRPALSEATGTKAANRSNP